MIPEVRQAEDMAPTIEQLKGRVDALYVCADPLFSTNLVRINALALQHNCRRCTAPGITSKAGVDVLWT